MFFRAPKAAVADVIRLSTSASGGISSLEQHSQSTEERSTLDRYLHFHGEHVCPISPFSEISYYRSISFFALYFCLLFI
jgi:hypothetical protein